MEEVNVVSAEDIKVGVSSCYNNRNAGICCEMFKVHKFAVSSKSLTNNTERQYDVLKEGFNVTQ